MTRTPPPRIRRPRLRWYLQLLRLRVAALLALPRGERLHRSLVLVATLAGLGAAFSWTLLAEPSPSTAEHEPVQAYIHIVWQVVIMIAAALISYALRPKPKDPEVAQANVPVAEDGKGIKRIFGSVWIDDPIVLGFKQLGTVPIKAKGGKK